MAVNLKYLDFQSNCLAKLNSSILILFIFTGPIICGFILSLILGCQFFYIYPDLRFRAREYKVLPEEQRP